jgi:hypothetical protein
MALLANSGARATGPGLCGKILKGIFLGLPNPMVLGGQDSVTGNPASSFRMDARGVWKALIPFPSATINTIQVDVQQAANLSPRPTITIKADAAAGITSDIVGTAASGAGFVTIGPLTVAPTSDAVLLVILQNNLDAQSGQCYWDNLLVLP